MSGWLSIGMVVIQPYTLVSKLKKNKTDSLRCTGYLNTLKTYKARFTANSSSYTTTELSKLLTSCHTSVNKTCYPCADPESFARGCPTLQRIF